MSDRQRKKKYLPYLSIATGLIPVAMLLFFSSCGARNKKFGEAITERDSLPVMRTLGVSSLISDSGITRYRIIAEEWSVFDRTDPTYWAFEKGLYLERFDSLFNVDANIQSDTAYYYDQQKLWELIGNVEIVNEEGSKFNTELLYWNQETEKVYSDRFIRIEEPDRIIMGHGFESNQQMTIYEIMNVEGIFYVEDEEEPVAVNDSIQ